MGRKNPDRNRRQIGRGVKQPSQTFFPDMKINHGMLTIKYSRGLYGKETHYIKVLELRPYPFWNLPVEERNIVARAYEAWIRTAPPVWGFTTLTAPSDVSEYITNCRMETLDMSERLQRERNIYLQWVESLAARTTEKSIYLWFEHERKPDVKYTTSVIAEELRITAWEIAQYFEQNLKIQAVTHTSEAEENHALENMLYRYLNRNMLQSQPFTTRMKKVEEDARIAHPGVDIKFTPLDYIAPQNINTTNSRFLGLNGEYYRVLKVLPIENQIKATVGWLEFLLKGTQVSFSIRHEKQSRTRTLEILNQNAKFSSAGIKAGATAAENRSKTEAYRNTDFMHQQISDGQDMWITYILICISAKTLPALTQLQNKIEDEAIRRGMKLAEVTNANEDAFLMTLPIGYKKDSVIRGARQDFLTEGVASCFLFVDDNIRQNAGSVLGVTTTGIMYLNPFNTSVCDNPNGVILGASGAGKSFVMSCFLRHIYLSGCKVRMILPIKGEMDYMKTTKSVYGQFIPFKPGSNNCINIFEIRPEDSGSNNTTQSLLTKKIKELISFFKIRGRNEDQGQQFVESDELSALLIKLYSRIGITNDNQSVIDYHMSGRPYPTFSTLDELCLEELKHPESEDVEKALKKIRKYMRRCISGNGMNLNGQTNVSLDNGWIVFDVDKDICGDMLPEYYYIAMCLAKADSRREQAEKLILFYDEIQEILSPATSDDVAEQYSTMRAYGSGVFCATQTVGNLSIGSATRNIQDTILGNSATTILLRSEPRQIEALQDTFGLTDEEAKYIRNPIVRQSEFPELTTNNTRGCGLVFSGTHYRFEFRSSPISTRENRYYEFALFNTDQEIAKKINALSGMF